MANDQYTFQDPTTQYPRPPFDKQSQPAPGLGQEMTPKPDHGETSYRGAGRLKGRKAVITGADSGIGRAVAIAFAREGADVVLSYLPEEEADAREVTGYIEAVGRKAVAAPGDLKDERYCQQLVETAVEQLGGMEDAVHQHAVQLEPRPQGGGVDGVPLRAHLLGVEGPVPGGQLDAVTRSRLGQHRRLGRRVGHLLRVRCQVLGLRRGAGLVGVLLGDPQGFGGFGCLLRRLGGVELGHGDDLGRRCRTGGSGLGLVLECGGFGLGLRHGPGKGAAREAEQAGGGFASHCQGFGREVKRKLQGKL